MTTEKERRHTVRLGEKLDGRIEAYQERFYDRNGYKLKLNDLIRDAILRLLDEAEKEADVR